MITLKIFGKRERNNHMNWNIITDSSCDLLPSTSPDGRIRLTSVPFTIRIGERDFVDDEHLDTLKNSILDIWENTSIEILPTRGLCSYYAERGGLIVSY